MTSAPRTPSSRPSSAGPGSPATRRPARGAALEAVDAPRALLHASNAAGALAHGGAEDAPVLILNDRWRFAHDGAFSGFSNIAPATGGPAGASTSSATCCCAQSPSCAGRLIRRPSPPSRPGRRATPPHGSTRRIRTARRHEHRRRASAARDPAADRGVVRGLNGARRDRRLCRPRSRVS